ncbi:hypothetical protein [Domibacillus indicus]|uniref:hypothetical protein n=1 Tax=Domibacillus indicus TaxID=1437523 RepID=UPI0006181D97|nr:hypothetical protein [Domibacillus indicus]
MITIEAYTEAVRDHLKKHSECLIDEIKKTLQFPFDEKVELVDFTAFVQPYELSITMFSMERSGNEVFPEEGSGLFAGSCEVLEDAEYYCVPDEDRDEFEAFSEQNSEALSKIETEEVTAWFASCWNEAGGSRTRLPAYFSFHDCDPCFDLHKGKWISDGDKWYS